MKKIDKETWFRYLTLLKEVEKFSERILFDYEMKDIERTCVHYASRIHDAMSQHKPYE